MDSSQPQILSYLQSKHEFMVEQLHQLCAINSGTSNLVGINQVRQHLHTWYQALADNIQNLPLAPVPSLTMDGMSYLQSYADALFICKRPHLSRRVLLCGHMDTVYPTTSSFQDLRLLNSNHLIGPGVADMKGGLILMLHALVAFEQTKGAASIGWDVLLTTDEEEGSPASSLLFSELSSRYQAVLIYEPALTDSGILVKNRKGSGKFTLIATGKSAHAGRDFTQGRNAICYLAEIITAINALNGKREGVNINIGKIAGGQAVNVVPDKAVAKLDIRINKPEDAAWIQDQWTAITQQFARKDYQLVIEGGFSRPVKTVSPATERLFNRIHSQGKALHLELSWKDSGGCCDGNNFSQLGKPVIDTLGVRGGAIHSHEEYILLDSLIERAALSALLLEDLALGGLEGLSL